MKNEADNQGRIVIVAYRAKPGKMSALKSLVRTHVQVLQNNGLVTDRAPTIMQSREGIIVEVFEWKSKRAIEQAHENPQIQKLWQAFADNCDYVPIANISEASSLFSEFAPLNTN